MNIYSPLIYRIATRIGLQDADASDVVQEVMRTVAQSIPQFEYDQGRGTFRAWLKTVTRSRIADYRRRGKHQAAHGNADEQFLLSWFIIFPNRPLPIWVTVVGGSAAGTPDYFQAHNFILPQLRAKPNSTLPQC